MSTRIVMTGATGGIGTPLFEALTARGEDVIVLSRDPASAKQRLAGAADYLPWREDMPASDLITAVDGTDAVIHLAGSPLFAGRVNRRGVNEANAGKVRSTSALAEAIGRAARPPRVFLNASSQGYYGFAAAERAGTSVETSAPGSDSWGRGSVQWEDAAKPATAAGTRLVLLRTGVFLGYRSGALASQLDQFRQGRGGWVRPGTQAVNWIHETDEIGLILRALDDDRVSGGLNLAAPHPVTHREFAESVGRLVGRPVRFGIPLPVLRVIMGAPAEIIARSHRVLPEKALALGYAFAFPRLDEALEDLIAGAGR